MSRPPTYPLDEVRPGIVNVWQRGVPVWEAPIFTPTFLVLLLLVGIGTVMAAMRFTGGLAPWVGSTDEYAWGVWKTFNVMALTALGSGAMAIGIAAWVFHNKQLHSIMRTALVTSFLLYFTGLLGIMTDVGRPWNFYHALLPWNWNTESALWEVSIAMPLYCVIFLAFENSPLIVERIWFTGSKEQRNRIRKWRPRMRKIYPFMIAGAFVVPIGHQSSLGGLMVLAGDKVHPLWQTPVLPLLYLVQAAICGVAFVTVCVMASCLVWRRPLDMKVIGSLSKLLSGLILFWLAFRFTDLLVRGQLGQAFEFDAVSIAFLLENLLVLLPAVVLLKKQARETPKIAFVMAILACIGGLLYRFLPTTVTYRPGEEYIYFPSVAELTLTAGLMAMAGAAFILSVKLFAVLPAPLRSWYEMMDHARREAAVPRTDDDQSHD
ncbi:MAG: NrfD/PsrC family molybdoenzyme membrane anchor subunit [Planctomycetota bacterium]|jgi:Ni/Fe-hydrogenase subunit HybB-like protein